MPLIVVTGLPSSGKSKFSEQLLRFFQGKLKENGNSHQIRIVSDTENLDWEGRNSVFKSIAKEKELRGWLKTETQRYLNLNQIVILDAAAYIKGFRYELFCISKEAKTQYCIVEKFLEPEICWEWNTKSIEEKLKDRPQDSEEPEPGYSRDVFDALLMRYEKCDESNRWDSPLFRITSMNEQINLDDLYSVIIKNEPLMPNKCTQLLSTRSTIFKPKGD